MFDPRDAQYIPQIVYDQKQKISSLHVAVVSLTLLTIFLWASFSVTSVTFGDLGIISLMFMVSWHRIWLHDFENADLVCA